MTSAHRLPANATPAALLADSRHRYARARPLGRAAFARAARALPGGNTRSVLHFPPFPLFAARSEGCRVHDLDGHVAIDFVGEFTAGLCGHDDPTIRAAVEAALARGWVNGAQIEAEAQFAEALCARFPSLERVRFCNSGTEANLMALTTARVTTGRPAIMAFRGGYHGGVLLFKDGPSRQNAPFPTVMADYNDADGTRTLIAAHAAELAAIIVEPMLGSGGCIPADPAFLHMLRAESARHGIVLIFDEIMTSRLAPGGLQEVHGVLPDLTTLGKYLGGGFPFGAFGGRAEILDRYDPARPDALLHAGTFNNNPFTMNAGLATVTQVYTPDRARALNASGERLRARLQAVADARGMPLRFSGVGSMIGLHVAAGPVARVSDPRDDAVAQDVKSLIHLELLQRGIYVARRGMIVLSLPMTEREHDALAAALDAVLDESGPALAAALGD